MPQELPQANVVWRVRLPAISPTCPLALPIPVLCLSDKNVKLAVIWALFVLNSLVPKKKAKAYGQCSIGATRLYQSHSHICDIGIANLDTSK